MSSPKMSRSSKELHLAVKAGRVSVVKFLLWAGANINERDGNSRTILHSVCETKDRETEEVVEVLLRFGAEVNAQDENGRTPLHEACRHLNLGVVEMLLRSGARIGSVDKYGWTPLYQACFNARNSDGVSIVNALLESHTSLGSSERTCNSELDDIVSVVNWKSKDGDTALHLASGQGSAEVVHSLLRAGAVVGVRNSYGMTALSEGCYSNAKAVVSLLLNWGAEVEEKDSTGKTALHWAGKAHSWDVVDVLVDNGGDLSAKDFNNNTPLHFACWPTCYDESPTTRSKTVESFLRVGARVDVKNKHLLTPYEELGPVREPLCSWHLRELWEEERMKIEEYFMKHVVKMKSLKLLDGFDIDWMSGQKFYDETRKLCCNELEAMKSTNVVEDVSSYIVLSRGNRPYLLSSEELLKMDEFLNSPDLLKRFPLYGDSLRTAFRRPRLLTLAVQSFYYEGRKQVLKSLPTEVVEMLLHYLTNNDLRNFLDSE